jgi:broad specificity phosphatase PhoE
MKINRAEMPTRLVVMRHLPSSANADGLLAGTWDVGLSPQGIAQAPEAKTQIQPFAPFGVVFSSDMKRAINTASRTTSQKPRQTRLLRERHLGDLEGTPVTPDFVRMLYTPLPQRRELSMAPGAENDNSMLLRWYEFLAKWYQRHRGQTGFAATHASLMGTVLDDLVGGTGVHKIENGGYFVLEADGNTKDPDLKVTAQSGIVYPFVLAA